MMDARVVNSDLVVELVRASHCLKLVTTLTLTLDLTLTLTLPTDH